jgi:outer membrane protein OmpA-like peptidoglycan-associated protein
MRFSAAALLTSLAALPLGALTPAFAQVASGNEVSVNPLAAAGTTLLYPGGQYMRVVHPLLQPGQKASDSGAITLHMPDKNAARAAAPRRAVAAAAPVRPAAKPAKPVAVAPAPARKLASAPPPGAASGTPPGAAGLALAPAPAFVPTTPKQQVAKAEPVAPPPPLSSIEPGAPGLSKRSVILFAAGSADPAQSALGAIKYLAGDLNTAMTSAGARVQLIAYGGNKGDKGSDARRLSLKRALAIRQVLIDDGVPSERIDVRAMGGADDGGPADRVDVYVKA